MPLAWYCEDSLGKGTIGRLLEGHEPKEGANGRQAQVACRDAGTPCGLEISKECADEVSIQIIDSQG